MYLEFYGFITGCSNYISNRYIFFNIGSLMKHNILNLGKSWWCCSCDIQLSALITMFVAGEGVY